MTSSDQKMHDDELDDFLAGRDALSRQLAALQQPASPKRVDDAVMAAIAARLGQEQEQEQEQAASAASRSAQVTQVAPRSSVAANMARWRAPAALAASLVGALLLTLEWQRGDYAQPASASAPASVSEQKQTVAVPPPVPATEAQIQRPAEPVAPAAPIQRARPVVKPALPVPAEVADKVSPSLGGTIAADQRLLDAASATTPALAPPAPPPPPSPAPAPAPAPDASLSFFARATSVPPAPIIAPAPPAPPAPTVVTVTGSARKAAPAADNARATDWLNVIDEMLKAGLRKDAIDEWRKFRVAYPDYPVPEELARQIAAID